MNNSTKSLASTLGKLILVGIIIFVYAYGVQETKIDLQKPQEAKRQEQLTNILRGLAHPDLVDFDTERVVSEQPILIPCVGPTPQPNPPVEGLPYISLSSYCAEPNSSITVFGSNYEARQDVFLFFAPYAEDPANQVELKLTEDRVVSGIDGTFTEEVTLKKDRLADEPATIRAVVNQRVGPYRPSQALIETIDKMGETIFLALLATTFGLIIAIPLSFLAARNLMLEITMPFAKLMVILVVAPIGAYLGFVTFFWLADFGKQLVGPDPRASGNALMWGALSLIGMTSVKQATITPSGSKWLRTLRQTVIFIIVAVVAVVGITALAQAGVKLGVSLNQTESFLVGVFGNFILVISDAILLSMPFLGAIIGLILFSSVVGDAVDGFMKLSSPALNKIISVIFALLAGAMFFGIITLILNWFYQFGSVPGVLVIPCAIGMAIGGTLSVVYSPDKVVPTGMYIYYVNRTIMNTLRSIEPLLMVVTFAVWVGIGPFAGVVALGLHTIVSLGKLFSEQVENISQGPIEAVKATGANRIQTIVYAVIPQIVPPYIAFTLYRWDINVRMSTIIGFGGGGGIGFLLSQNINLLKYRQASVNMIAIALVVITLDYISARVRERIT